MSYLRSTIKKLDIQSGLLSSSFSHTTHNTAFVTYTPGDTLLFLNNRAMNVDFCVFLFFFCQIHLDVLFLFLDSWADKVKQQYNMTWELNTAMPLDDICLEFMHFNGFWVLATAGWRKQWWNKAYLSEMTRFFFYFECDSIWRCRKSWCVCT